MMATDARAVPSPPLLEVEGLAKHFPIVSGRLRRTSGWIKAVEDVSFSLAPGETLGLVGESGCGKTTTGRLILRLVERTAGRVTFHVDGRRVDPAALRGRDLRVFRRHMQLVFQDPFSSLNPRMTVRDIIAEPLRAHGWGNRGAIDDRVRWLMTAVGLNVDYVRRYPHAFSGGQRQRICIARALAVNPRLVVCDEPVSALDVSVQAQILNLLKELQEEFGLAYLFIAHDLSVVENISARVAVMYAGRIVEMAANRDLYGQPLHPYTEALMMALPKAEPRSKGDRVLLQGEVADPSELPTGCAFHPRCPYRQPICQRETPPLRAVKGERLCACHFADTLALRGI